MHKFKDNEGREWSLSLNCWQIKTLKETIGFDARDHESILSAADDPGLLCDVLFVLCQDQAKAAGVTDRQFGEALAGDVIEQAANAYIEETIDFFPQRQRQILRTAMQKMTETKDRAMTLAETKLSSPEMESAIQKSLDDASLKMSLAMNGTTSGKPSGSLPASLV